MSQDRFIFKVMCNICVLRSSDFFAVMYILWSKQNLQFSKVNGKKINDKIKVVYRDYWSYFFWKPWKPYNKQKFNSGILYPVCLHQYTCISIFEKWAWWDPVRQWKPLPSNGTCASIWTPHENVSWMKDMYYPAP